MEQQHMYSFPHTEQSSWPRSFQNQDVEAAYDPRAEMPIMGGEDMDRVYSDESSRSANSNYTVYTHVGTASSPMTDYATSPNPGYDYGGQEYEIKYTPTPIVYSNAPVESSSFQGELPYRQRESSHSYGTQHSQPNTPSALSWTPEAAQWKYYSFKVPKHKEPYLELLSGITPSEELPLKVYLDKFSGTRQKPLPEYRCQFPDACSKKFKRPADLQRHYSTVHACEESKDKFYCDYPRCERSTRELTRKDHQRDHYKEYHKEDIGHAKNPKNGEAMGKRQRERAKQQWVEERRVDPAWWRCHKCLTRVYVAEKGWVCELCKVECDEERQLARTAQGQAQGGAGYEGGYEEGRGGFESGAQVYAACASCQGSGWVDNGYGAWQVCTCQSATSGYQQAQTPASYGYEEGDGYRTAYSTNGYGQ